MMRETANTDELLHLAEAALDDGRPDTTLELCGQLLEMQPELAQAIFLSAEALRDLRELESAEHHYRQVIERRPQHSPAWSGLGAVLFDSCQPEAALQAFHRAIRIDQHNADALYGRALVRERRGDQHGARRDYYRAWRLTQRYPPPESLSDDDVSEMLLDAAKHAPPAVSAWIQQAPVLVVDLPDEDTCEAYDPPASPAELLGHLAAPMHMQVGAANGWSSFVPAVVLYRKNIARFAHDREQLVHALGKSVLGQVDDWLSGPALSE